MRVVYMGTPEFAVPALRALVGAGHEVTLVVTQPDRKKGRGRKLAPTPVKEAALELGIEVIQPAKLAEPGVIERLRAEAPEAIVLIAYGNFLKKEVLDLPLHGCINAHASLLPKYRGAAPIRWAIMKGDDVTGVTAMLMDEGMDTGGMLLKKEVGIAPDDSRGSLSEKLGRAAAEVVVETLARLERGDIEAEPQDHSEASYAPKLMKEDGRIEWFLPAEQIARVVRAFDPWPGTFTTIKGRQTKIVKARPEAAETAAAPGVVLSADKAGILVACGEGALRVLELQPPGKRPMSAADYLAGRKLEPGTVLG